MTYNEQVRAIAEEMTLAMHGFTYEKLTQHYLPAAHIAVKHMVEAATNALVTDHSGAIDPDGTIYTYLLERGFIPDTAEPVKQPEREDWKL